MDADKPLWGTGAVQKHQRLVADQMLLVTTFQKTLRDAVERPPLPSGQVKDLAIALGVVIDKLTVLYADSRQLVRPADPAA